MVLTTANVLSLTPLTSFCNNFVALHVSDLLRDKLKDLGVELIDSKARVANLEQAQSADRDALRLSNTRLGEASTSLSPSCIISLSAFSLPAEQVNVLAGQIKRQQEELHEMLSLSSDLQVKLSISNERSDLA